MSIDLYNKYNDKSLLFIGPGKSQEKINLDRAKSKVDYIASLNDVILDHKSDFYFVGEKFIFDYVESSVDKKQMDDTSIIFLALHKKHNLRIDSQYYESKRNDYKNIYMVESKSKLKDLPMKKYFLPCIRGFSKKNMKVLTNLLRRFPKNKPYYIRSRTLSNALQVIYNLGFLKVYLIGFMDSMIFTRSNQSSQEVYMKTAKQIKPSLRPPKERTEDELKLSFEYQCQVMITVDYVYKSNNKNIINLCPKSTSPEHYLDYGEI